MKLLFLGICFFVALLGENVSARTLVPSKLSYRHYAERNIDHTIIKRHTEQVINQTFIEQLTDIAMKSMEDLSDFGHKLMYVEEIGNISRTSDQNEIRVTACRFNDLNQKNEIKNHPEINVSTNDFLNCDVCRVKINKTETNTYHTVEMACVL